MPFLTRKEVLIHQLFLLHLKIVPVIPWNVIETINNLLWFLEIQILMDIQMSQSFLKNIYQQEFLYEFLIIKFHSNLSRTLMTLMLHHPKVNTFHSNHLLQNQSLLFNILYHRHPNINHLGIPICSKLRIHNLY